MNNDSIKNLNKYVADYGLSLSDSQLDKFNTFYEMLIEKNKVMNLTAIVDFDEVLIKHFADSLSLAFVLKEKGISDSSLSLIDVGTGAGFPGIPLAIAYPNLTITLMDSLNKRINFLNDVIDKLDLSNCNTIHSRAEELGKTNLYRQSYDMCVSRAVANISTLSEYCLPFVKVGGYFVSYKSEKLEEELLTGKKAIDILGGEIDSNISFVLPNSDINRNLLVIKKIKSTPNKYPRKAGTPGKEPL